MKTPAYLLGLALLAGNFSSPAQAGDWQYWEQSRNGYYGLGIGLSLLAYNKSNIATAFAAASNNSSLNNNDFTFNIFGGYQLDPFLGLEFGISQLSNTIATTNGTPTKLFNTYTAFIDAIMTHRYNDKAALYGKIGAHFWNLGSNSSTTLTEGTDLSLGAGLEFTLSGDTGHVVRIGWNRYLFNNIYIDTVDTVSLSLVFKH